VHSGSVLEVDPSWKLSRSLTLLSPQFPELRLEVWFNWISALRECTGGRPKLEVIKDSNSVISIVPRIAA